MSDLGQVVHRFAGYEFEIRRRWSNPEFRAMCEDYAAAKAALARWEGDSFKADDYRQLILELEDEILENLRKPIGPISNRTEK